MQTRDLIEDYKEVFSIQVVDHRNSERLANTLAKEYIQRQTKEHGRAGLKMALEAERIAKQELG